MAYAGPVFSSGNPTVDQLFGRQFAVNQSETAQQMEKERNAIARQQIMAQERVAQAQLAGQQQQQREANLFRMEQARDNKALGTRQLDIMEDDVKQRGSTRTDRDAELRKAAITDANAAAINDAQRANALLMINIESAVGAAKKALPMNAGFFGGNTAANLDDPNHPSRRAIAKAAFDTVRNQLLAEKSGALQSLIPDADTFTFRPVQYDETGKSISLSIPAGGQQGLFNAVKPMAPGPTTQASPPPFNMAPAPTASASTAFGNPFASGIASLFGARSGNAPAPVRIPVPDGVLEMPSEVAEEVSRQVAAIPVEQRAAARDAILGGLLKSGRAKVIAPFQAPISSTLGY